MERRGPIGVLFICMGNICRSPLAEGVFLHEAARRGLADRFDVDSAGTGGWHAGEPADPRAAAVAERRGIALPSRARRIDPDRDWRRFEHLLVMDRANRDDVLSEGAPPERVRLLRTHDPLLVQAAPDELDVPDPYYGGPDGFERVLEMVERACAGLLDELVGRS